MHRPDRRPAARAALLPILVALLSSGVRAQDCAVGTFLPPAIGVEHAGFGGALDLDGDVAIIGSLYKPECSPGHVHILRQSPGGAGWQVDGVLAPPPGEPISHFGRSVAIDGDYAIVSAPEYLGFGSTPGTAAIYHFDGSGWVFEQTVFTSTTASVGASHFSVAISGDVAVVGCFGDGTHGPLAGAAYVHRRTPAGWVEEQALYASNAAPHGVFGMTVAADGNVIAVGAPATTGGSAYVFRYIAGGWVEQQRILPLSGAPSDDFGRSVALANECLVVGAPWRNSATGVVDTGSAYAFRYDGVAWWQEAEFVSSTPIESAKFGTAVATDGETAAVGIVHLFWQGGGPEVSLFRFVGGLWQPEQEFDSPATVTERFGLGLAIEGSTLLIGSPEDPSYGERAGAVHSFAAGAGGWSEQQVIRVPAGAPEDELGRSVAIDGDLAVAAAPGDAGPEGRTGVIGAYRRVAGVWSFLQRIEDPFSAPGDPFVESVALDGDLLAAGSGEVRRAALFRYDGSGWLPEALLAEPDATEFGSAIAADGDVLWVGAPLDGPGPWYAYGSGSAFAYRRQGGDWVLEGVFSPTGLTSGARFGGAVAVSGDCAIVGAHLDQPVVRTGSATIYRHVAGSWVEEQTLVPSDGQEWDSFGVSVAISGDVAVVGATRNDTQSYRSGSVYVFRHDGSQWVEEQKLGAWDGDGGVLFGSSVACDGSAILIGAPYAGAYFTKTGGAYLFDHIGGSWIGSGRFEHSNGATLDEFGRSVDIDGGTAIIGAPRSHVACLPSVCPDCDAGVVRLYDVENCAAGTAPGQYTLYFSDAIGPTGGVATIRCLLDIEAGASPLAGWSFGVCHDELELLAFAVAPGATTSTVKNGAPAEFMVATLDPSGGVTQGVIVCFTSCASLAAGTGHELLDITYEPIAASGTDSILGYCDDAWIPGQIPVSTVVVADGWGLTPVQEFGVVRIRSDFVRGDCEGSGAIEIADAMFALLALFAGGAAPPCSDACDTNDDGLLDVGDPIHALTYIIGAGPPPLSPHPECGEDPTADPLLCESAICD